MTECEKFFGRLRDLCEGCGFDGRPHPPPHAVEQFRAHVGLPPLEAYAAESGVHFEIDGALSETSVDSSEMAPLPTTGPGTKLEELFAQLNVPYYEDCGCQAFARQMDAWGILGCREHFDEIVTRLRITADKYSLLQRFEAAVRATSNGLAFKLNPLDPFPGLLEEALQQAERETRSELGTTPTDVKTSVN